MHLVQTMAYAGAEPWHGLGNKLAPNQPIELWAERAGMNWRIEEAEVRFVAAGNRSLGSIHAFPEQKVPVALSRSGGGPRRLRSYCFATR